MKSIIVLFFVLLAGCMGKESIEISEQAFHDKLSSSTADWTIDEDTGLPKVCTVTEEMSTCATAHPKVLALWLRLLHQSKGKQT